MEGNILDFGELQAKEFQRKMKRIDELNRLIHCCLVTTNSIVDIQDQKRIMFSSILEKYRISWQEELKELKNKMSR